MKIIAYLDSRLREPSTWASMAAMLGGAGVAVPSGLWQYVAMTGMGAAGILGVILAERSTPAPKA